LRKSLSGVVHAEQFEAADVAGTARPEELDVDAWVRLAEIVHG
jgi:16S rRNA (adenine1518-N6/adenine1519-N6)-dimethyltransferase